MSTDRLDAHYPDHLFHNLGGGKFEEALPALVKDHDASHGVQWVDFDRDGALDLALTNNDTAGGHHLLRNLLPRASARQSLAIDVVDASERHTRAGTELRVYAAGTRRLIASGIVDTRGYCSQSVMPVHLGTGDAERLDIEVSSMSAQGRKVTRLPNVIPHGRPTRCA